MARNQHLEVIMPDSKETPPSPATTETWGPDFDTDAAHPVAAIRAPAKSSWKHLFAFTKLSHVGPLVAALVASAATAGLKTVLAVILGAVFDVVGGYGDGTRSGPDTISSISHWSLVIMGLGIANWAANSVFLVLWIVFGELQAASVRTDIFQILLASDMAWFDSQEQGMSSLLVRIQTQTRELQLATSQLFGLLTCDVLTSFASFAVALYYSWKLTLVLLATLPVSAVVLALATRKLEPAIQAQRRELATASKHVTSSFAAIDLVKVFNGHDHEIQQYVQVIRDASKHYLVQAICNSIQMGYVSFWVISMFVVGFWYGAVLIEEGLSPGSVLTTFYATLASFQSIEALMPHWLVLSKGMSAGAFLKAVVTSSNGGYRRSKPGQMLRPLFCAGDVELSDVSFAYPSAPKNKVLNKSSFFFPAGEITFLVGRSGSGKSTIGNIIANFYEPLTGDIQIDGKSTRILDDNWIHENITLIQQSSVLFNDTFMMNVAFGSTDPNTVTSQQALDACDASALQSTIAQLPQGLETNVGPKGHDLSGGQKQRLALARAYIRNPPVLILDEVTSGLDQVTRCLVMESIRRWRRNKTTIIITHDTSQIADGDFVYVMSNSYIVQEGYKRDLLKQEDGHFASLTTSSLDDLGVSIPDINVISSDTPEVSPDTPLINTRTSRLADFFLAELERNALRPASPGLNNRTSLGAGAEYAFRLRREQVLDPIEHDTSTARTRASFHIDLKNGQHGDLKRFSRFVTGNFWPDYGNQEHLGQSSDPVHAPNCMDFSRTTTTELLAPEHDNRSSTPTSPWGPEPPADTIEMSNILERGPHQTNVDVSRSSSTLDRHSPNLSEMDELSPNPEDSSPPSKEPKKKSSVLTTLATVWPTITLGDRIILVLGILSCIMSAACTPAFSYAFAQLLGILTSPGEKLTRGTKWALVMLALAIADGFSWGGSRYLLERVGQAWVDRTRAEAFRRILQQPKPWFEKSKNTPGRISECLDRNAEEMRNIVGKFVPIIISVTTMISVSVFWSLVVSWKLTLVSLSPLPVILAAVKGFAIVSGKWEERCNQSAEDASATLTEICLNIRAVRTLTLGGHFSAKYHACISHTQSTGLRRGIYSCGLYGLYQSLNYAMTALVFYYGTVLLAGKKELSVAEVMQVINLLLFSIGTSTGLLSSIPQLTMAQATASQLLGYASLPTDPPEGQQGQTKLEAPTPVQMNNLRFNYPQSPVNNLVLRGTTISIDEGRCTAIVGPSGCGKSTIISLLLGLYIPRDPSSLTFAHTPSSHVDIRKLRSTMAYVPQTPFLFPASIADNITYGLPQDSPYRQSSCICRATEAAGLHDWVISLPEGYSTRVGDGAQCLSGGQSQRLSIARAIVRRPRLLVLDEPTSALDAENAELIRRTIRDLASSEDGHGIAVVLVTHSRDMMRAADRIIVLGEGGVMMEEGSYEDLWMARGAFARLIGGTE